MKMAIIKDKYCDGDVLEYFSERRLISGTKGCTNRAKVERNGKYYCLIHDPVRQKEREDKKDQKELEKFSGICCVCGHLLGSHIDEDSSWRCHSIGRDGLQCECALQKSEIKNNIKFYDLMIRIKKQRQNIITEIG